MSPVKRAGCKISCNQEVGGGGGGEGRGSLAGSIFFPIPRKFDVTSGPCASYFSRGREKKSECSICVFSVSKMAITFNRLPIVSLFLVKVQRNLSSFVSFY